MALVKQDDTGEVVGANSYVDALEFKAYHEARCNDVSTYGISADIEPALIKARDYLDIRWDHLGTRKAEDQTTEYPRQGVETIPVAVKEAQIEYALIELTAGPLWPIPTRDATGSAIKLKREKVDVLEEETEYVAGSIQTSPVYPTPDNKLKRATPQLISVGGSQRA